MKQFTTYLSTYHILILFIYLISDCSYLVTHSNINIHIFKLYYFVYMSYQIK